MKGKTGRSLLALGALSLLAACSGTIQQKLGLERRVPDEFQVVRRAPLTLPPDFTLRPPTPGQPAARNDTSLAAQEILVGRAPDTPAAESPGERALLAAVKVRAEPDIRRKLVEDYGDLVDLDEGSFLFILDFQRDQFEPKGTVIDPAAEAAKLRAEGRARRVVTNRVESRPLFGENPS